VKASGAADSCALNMTRPKKWFLDEDADKGIVLKNAPDGTLIKKNRATEPLGRIITVSSQCYHVCTAIIANIVSLSLVSFICFALLY